MRLLFCKHSQPAQGLTPDGIDVLMIYRLRSHLQRETHNPDPFSKDVLCNKGEKKVSLALSFAMQPFFPSGPSIADPHGEKKEGGEGCCAALSFDVVRT